MMALGTTLLVVIHSGLNLMKAEFLRILDGRITYGGRSILNSYKTIYDFVKQTKSDLLCSRGRQPRD